MTGTAGEVDEAGESALTAFLGSLGVADIILGAVAIYLRYVTHVPPAPALPSTGHDQVDIALLVAAAAFVGQMLSFAVSVWMAIINTILRRSFFSAAVDNARATIGVPTAGADPTLDPVIAIIGIRAPHLAKQADLIRERAMICYGAALVTLVYARTIGDVLGRSWMTAAVLAAGLLSLGVVHQVDRVRQVIAAAHAVNSEARHAGADKDTHRER